MVRTSMHKSVFRLVFLVVCLSVGMFSLLSASISVSGITPTPIPSRCSAQAGAIGDKQFDDSSLALGDLPLRRIEIENGDVVDAIEAFYGQQSGGRHGQASGGVGVVTIDSDDALVEVSGYHGIWFGGDYILQLTFKTAKGLTFGPFGSMSNAENPTPFSLKSNADQRILGFCGSLTYGNNQQAILLGSLGIIVSSPTLGSTQTPTALAGSASQ